MIRLATLDDLSVLLALENSCFSYDRISKRSFRYLLTKGHALTIIAEEPEGVLGYAMLLFNLGTPIARIYSIAVNYEKRGRGVGHQLMAACDFYTKEHQCISLRLEVRPDNHQAITLFTKHGFKQFGVYNDYYEDHSDALRLEKDLAAQLRPPLDKVPYYEQTLDFTCGPACLLMAMKSLKNDLELSRKLELRLWREATTIFMTSGHGGCGPYGLALAACRRGFHVSIYVNDEGALFVDSVRDTEKKEVMRLVQEDFLEEIRSLPIEVHYHALDIENLATEFNHGAVPLVLISSYRLYQEKFPHWVVITGVDDRYVYFHDSYVDYEKQKTRLDCMNIPIPRSEFARMARYGKSGQKAALILRSLTHKLD